MSCSITVGLFELQPPLVDDVGFADPGVVDVPAPADVDDVPDAATKERSDDVVAFNGGDDELHC